MNQAQSDSDFHQWLQRLEREGIEVTTREPTKAWKGRSASFTWNGNSYEMFEDAEELLIVCWNQQDKYRTLELTEIADPLSRVLR